MVKYMKEKGLTSSTGSDSGGGGGGSSSASSSSANDVVSSVEDKKKKVRELPSSVDPADDDDVSPKSSSSGDSKTKAAKKKSSSSSKKKSKGKRSKSKSSTGKGRKKSLVKSSTGAVNKKSPLSAKSKSSSKGKFKMVANTEMALKPLQVKGVNYGEMTFDEKKVQFMQTLLKANVSKLKSLPATEPSEEGKKAFSMYNLDEKKPLETGKPHSAKALYTCTHKSFSPDIQVVAKVYDAATYDPKSSLFLKVLRHLGKLHPNVIQTWDVINKGDSVYVFQELAPYGNLADYVKKKGPLGEKECQLVACQLRTGMDFLGDMGISHRDISPRHLLLVHKDMRVKLTGFRSAVIYYNEKSDEINFQPCLPVKKKGKEGAEDYHAPESYGNSKKEQFDPVAADVFSAGATLYHLLTGKFPFDASKSNPKVENEIQGNVRALKKVSDNGKSALGYMLTTFSDKRFTVERLKEHPWFHEK
ncbi:PREDICTED: aurora kinase B-B-like [Rhagoletis zephyria]|uniref:aurora kinase B-B-like n=1 Tax=Rhagoletis zephyria TaxID=28612 RepID=UPI0008118BE9|nr:PREDICTED: aurora kinase B-B-like [Rhagoletis zephyria]